MDRLLEFVANNTLLVGATLAMLIAAILFEVRHRSRSVFEVEALQAVKLINQGATVVDLRDPERYAGGHIGDALNMPEAEVGKREDKRLKKKRPVLLVCDTGSASIRAAARLREAGYEMSYALKGGIGSWQRENLPLVSGDAGRGSRRGT